MSQRFTVTFYPDNKSVMVEKDRTVLYAAISAGVFVNSSCGGDGVCGRCKVRVRKGTVAGQPSGLLNEQERLSGMCLACTARVIEDCEVEIPVESRLDLGSIRGMEEKLSIPADSPTDEIVEQAAGRAVEKLPVVPVTRKIALVLPEPDLQDHVSDLERVFRQIMVAGGGAVDYTGLVNIRSLADMVRSSQWQVTALLGRRNGFTELLTLEPGNTSGRNYGCAFDIGTTMVSGQLIDLTTGAVLGTKAMYNKQAAFGADVITRIMYARKKDGLMQLHAAVTGNINEIIAALAGEHAVDRNEITCVVCAGNPTMTHLLLQVDPAYIRREPYIPAANAFPVVRTSETDIAVNPRGLLYCAPGIASYVGSDVTAGVLATGLDTQAELSLLIDIGTNGEIVLGNRDFMVATAASAGPAFEGSGMTCGMRSSVGAIGKVSVDRKGLAVSYNTIGDSVPRGICGSGYIDLIASMLAEGILDKNGAINLPDGHARLRVSDGVKAFVVAEARDSATKQDIVVTETDIDNIKRAKAAIYAATCMLVRHMSLDIGQVRHVFIAGGFGTSLNVANAVAIGLLPPLDNKRFRFVGNSSLSGARMALVSDQARTLLEGIAGKMTYVELSSDSRYMDEYIAALFFPHTDVQRFKGI